MAETAAPSSLLRPLVEDLEARRAHVKLGGGEAKIAQQHAREKLTARERLALLIDEGTFVELGIHGRPHFSQRAMDGVDAPADGVITGYGKVDGRRRRGILHPDLGPRRVVHRGRRGPLLARRRDARRGREERRGGEREGAWTHGGGRPCRPLQRCRGSRVTLNGRARASPRGLRRPWRPCGGRRRGGPSRGRRGARG